MLRHRHRVVLTARNLCDLDFPISEEVHDSRFVLVSLRSDLFPLAASTVQRAAPHENLTVITQCHRVEKGTHNFDDPLGLQQVDEREFVLCIQDRLALDSEFLVLVGARDQNQSSVRHGS